MMMYYIVTVGLLDANFITRRTDGFKAFKIELLSINLDQLGNVTEVKREHVKAAAIAYPTAAKAMSFHGLGVIEHSQGTFTVMQIADLALLTGNIGSQRCWSKPASWTKQGTRRILYGGSKPSRSGLFRRYK